MSSAVVVAMYCEAADHVSGKVTASDKERIANTHSRLIRGIHGAET